MSRTAIISVDGHVKASRPQYRTYLEQAHLDAYDDEVRAADAAGLPDAGNLRPELDPAVQWDSTLRLEHLDRMGVVAEVLFPNGQPFQLNPLDDHPRAATPELQSAGRRAYNRWLVDFCAEAPDRRRGQVQVSFLDIEQAAADVRWAKEQGLGGVLLPELRADGRSFADKALDPIWAACVETGLPVSAHGGANIPDYGPSGFAAMVSMLAETAFYSNRSLGMLIAGGVFDRFPDFKIVYTETQPYLIAASLYRLDEAVDPSGDWMAFARTINRDQTTGMLPSEYLGRNVFVGVSPFSPVQLPYDELVGKDATGARLPGVHIGAAAAAFGVDFPQLESIFDRTMEEVAGLVAAPSVSEADARMILFENAAALYGFDMSVLQPLVERIGFDLDTIAADTTISASAPTRVPLMRSAIARAAGSPSAELQGSSTP